MFVSFCARASPANLYEEGGFTASRMMLGIVREQLSRPAPSQSRCMHKFFTKRIERCTYQ